MNTINRWITFCEGYVFVPFMFHTRTVQNEVCLGEAAARASAMAWSPLLMQG